MRDTRTEHFATYKTGTVPRKSGRIGSPVTPDSLLGHERLHSCHKCFIDCIVSSGGRRGRVWSCLLPYYQRIVHRPVIYRMFVAVSKTCCKRVRKIKLFISENARIIAKLLTAKQIEK